MPDRKWYKEQVQIKAEKEEAARLRAQERERQKAKRDQKRRLIMRKMGGCRYYLCCCMREAYYQIAIGDRDGRPDFENPLIKEMTTRESRFKTTNKNNDEIFEKQANAVWEEEILKARREREAIAKKKEADRKARQQRRAKRNRTRHTTSHKRGYPSLSSKAETRSKFQLEYTRLKNMNNTRVAPEEAW